MTTPKRCGTCTNWYGVGAANGRCVPDRLPDWVLSYICQSGSDSEPMCANDGADCDGYTPKQPEPMPGAKFNNDPRTCGGDAMTTDITRTPAGFASYSGRGEVFFHIDSGRLDTGHTIVALRNVTDPVATAEYLNSVLDRIVMCGSVPGKEDAP